MRSPTRSLVIGLGLAMVAFTSGCNLPDPNSQELIWVGPCEGCVGGAPGAFHAYFEKLVSAGPIADPGGSATPGTSATTSLMVEIRGLGSANSYGVAPSPLPTADPLVGPLYTGSAVASQLTLDYSPIISDDGCAAKAKQAAAEGRSLEVYGEGTVIFSGGTSGCGGTMAGQVACDTVMPSPTVSIQATQITSCAIVDSGYPGPVPAPSPTATPL